VNRDGRERGPRGRRGNNRGEGVKKKRREEQGKDRERRPRA
jgi:hypothetical protein